MNCYLWIIQLRWGDNMKSKPRIIYATETHWPELFLRWKRVIEQEAIKTTRLDVHHICLYVCILSHRFLWCRCCRRDSETAWHTYIHTYIHTYMHTTIIHKHTHIKYPVTLKFAEVNVLKEWNMKYPSGQTTHSSDRLLQWWNARTWKFSSLQSNGRVSKVIVSTQFWSCSSRFNFVYFIMQNKSDLTSIRVQFLK